VIPYAREIGGVVVVAVLVFSHGCAYRMGGASDRAALAENRRAWAEQVAHAEKVARETEQRHAKSMAAIAEQHEKDKRDAEGAQRALVDALRAGNLRLQDRWAGCVSEAGRTAAELDAAKRDREESAARIIAAADQCDAQNRGLQDVIRADRK
jgi:hypothetical protein